MNVYKLVRRPLAAERSEGPRLRSYAAYGTLAVFYEPGKWAEPPSCLPESGLLVFCDIESVRAFLASELSKCGGAYYEYFANAEVWEAEAEEPVALPVAVPFEAHDPTPWKLAALGEAHLEYCCDWRWPAGTLAFRRVRLARRIGAAQDLVGEWKEK